MKKNIIIVVGIVIVIGVSGVTWYGYNMNKYAPKVYVEDTPKGEVTKNVETGTTSTTTPTFTLADVATHKDDTSCYTVINNSVYDLTAFVNMHPGGKGAILSICGINGTEKFMDKHGTKEKVKEKLSRMKIGNLSQ